MTEPPRSPCFAFQYQRLSHLFFVFLLGLCIHIFKPIKFSWSAYNTLGALLGTGIGNRNIYPYRAYILLNLALEPTHTLHGKILHTGNVPI